MYLPGIVAALGAVASMTCASPCTNPNPLPLVTLPYGTWRAARHDAKADVYTFRNIRYAAPPTGPRRFAHPTPPDPVDGIQDGSYGPRCIQKFQAVTEDDFEISEDCLFLDVYAPRAGVEGGVGNIPVIVWIHGGSFTSGAKDDGLAAGLFDGTGLVHQARGEAVVVVMNYRLGLLGWLGGPSAQNAKASNLGLHDQRAALQWVRDYIALFGGDPSNVSAWGSSAGSGSIVHHITQKGGRRDPLFEKAVLQSPGFATIWDMDSSEGVVHAISGGLGCGTGVDFECMRSANVSTLLSVWDVYLPSPVPDGDFVERPAMLELADGRFWRGLESVVSSHTQNEGFPWALGGTVKTEEDFVNFVLSTFGNRSSLATHITAMYSSRTPADRYQTMLNDIIFLCQARYPANAFGNKVYAGVYSVGTGSHSSDMFATWYNPTLGLEDPTTVGNPVLNNAYQAYLVSHARTGDVNTFRSFETSIEWPRVSDAEAENLNALESNDEGFRVIESTQARRSGCDFWVKVYRDLWEHGPS